MSVARRFKQRLAVMAAVTLLAGCQGSGFGQVEREIDLDGNRKAEAQVYTDLIAQLLNQEQYFAALAHIEEHRIDVGPQPRLSLFEAQALYGLRYDGQARAIYLDLLGGAYDGFAHHGLGLIAARAGRLDQALPRFIRAVQSRPTDVAMRNDLGYALMQAGRFDDARLQLSTSLELSPSNTRAQTNLMLLMLTTGDEQGARRLADAAGLNSNELASLREQARRMQREIAASSGGTS